MPHQGVLSIPPDVPIFLCFLCALCGKSCFQFRRCLAILALLAIDSPTRACTHGLWLLWHRHSCLCCRDTTSIMRTPFSCAARCPLIPLSSLSEPAGARPEF